MTSQTHFVQPPRLAVWLVNLFTPAGEAESILGDLQEEFSHLVSKSGAAFARSWYWRQAVKTTAHLVGTGWRVAPWSTAGAVVGGFLLRWFVSGFLQPAITAVLDRYRVYENHPDAYLFWLTHGLLIGHAILTALVGGLVALAANGREMTATITLALVTLALGVPVSLMMAARTGDNGYLWQLPWMFTFAIATVVGGAIVRTRRSAAITRPSAT